MVNTFGSAQLRRFAVRQCLQNYNARTEFDEATLLEAQKIAERGIPISELSERMDLTDMDIFTIDSSDSKDLDDAVSLEEDEEHFFLGVHIADVSHYVRQAARSTLRLTAVVPAFTMPIRSSRCCRKNFPTESVHSILTR